MPLSAPARPSSASRRRPARRRASAAPAAPRRVPAPPQTRAPAAPVTSFDQAGLPVALVRVLARRGMRTPFPIQAATLPDALVGAHVLGRARTGSGKTLAFGLPLLARLATGGRSQPARPRGLVLVPTRELAQQVTDALAPLAQPLQLKVTAVYGGASIGRQVSALARGADVVVATPGRLEDLLARGACHLGDVRIAVLDEADHMCDLGFLPVVRRLLGQVPADGQRLLFSATLDHDVDVLVREHLPLPVLVELAGAREEPGVVEHHAFEATDKAHKVALAAELAAAGGRSLLFTRTKHGADRLARQLERLGADVVALHGGMAQNARTRALRAFADGTRPVLVATDVAARGIHVDEVDRVVHVDLPTEAKAFLHRSGRTGRAGASGTVIMLSLPEERRTAEALLRAAAVTAPIVPVAPGSRHAAGARHHG